MKYLRSKIVRNFGKNSCIHLLLLIGLFAIDSSQCAVAAAAVKQQPAVKQPQEEQTAEPSQQPKQKAKKQKKSVQSPAIKQPAAMEGALLPSHRIVAYYGNFLSPRMGVLGEYPPDQMLRMLNKEVRKWEDADPSTPVVPAIEYIAIVAQAGAGRDGKYRARMSDSEIDKAIALAKKVDGIVILDVQIGLSSVQSEIQSLEKYLKMPNVMLALDPEFSMKAGSTPGKRIGTMDASDINYAINYLAKLVRKYDLPPKVLIIHRFTQRMVTNYRNIKLVPEVQIVMDMDGFGPQQLKIDSYRAYVAREPVQFTGVKLFYKNDSKGNSKLFTPEQLLKFNPVPTFIMFQ